MQIIVIIAIVIAALVGLAKVASHEPYKEMTEEEFEAEAKRSSRIGGALLEFQKAVDPSHKVEYAQLKEKHGEAESAESGDKPETGSQKPDTLE
jgi:hypothetical protein